MVLFARAFVRARVGARVGDARAALATAHERVTNVFAVCSVREV